MANSVTRHYQNWTDEQKSRSLALRLMGRNRMEAARDMGVPYTTLQRWEQGIGAPPPEMVEQAQQDLSAMFEGVARNAIEDLSKDELRSLDPDVRVRVAATAAKAAIELRQEGQPSKHLSLHATAQDAREALKALLAERMGLQQVDMSTEITGETQESGQVDIGERDPTETD